MSFRLYDDWETYRIGERVCYKLGRGEKGGRVTARNMQPIDRVGDRVRRPAMGKCK